MYRQYTMGAALAVLVSTTGCASGATYASNTQQRAEATTLIVENNNWMDMTVYVVRDGMKARMGSVTSLGRTRFVLPPALLGGTGQIRVLADPLGSSATYLSDPILVLAGQQVRFRVENNIRQSSFAVY